MRSLFAAIVAVFLAAPAFGAQQQPTDDSPQSVPVTAGGQAPDADTAPQSAQAPVHTHTGWKTLLKDTGRDFVAFPKRPSTWTLLGIGAAGALATYPADDHVETHIVGNRTTDRFFSVGQGVGSVYAQTTASVGLWAVGRYIVAPAANESRTNKYSEIGFDLMRAQIVSQVLAHGMKYSIRRDRPTGECCAFPSGHSATAFAAASVLERHFGYRASWPALVAASYVGASRLVDNRHFLSDVLMGAGVGIASGWTVVGTRGRSAFTLQPVPMKRGMMIAVTRVQSPPRSTESSRRSLRRLPSDRGRESPVGR